MSCFDSFPTLNKCCYCIPLKYGCYIIGVYLVLSVIYFGIYPFLGDIDSNFMYANLVVAIIYVVMGTILLVAVYVVNNFLLVFWICIAFANIIFSIVLTGFSIYMVATTDTEYEEEWLYYLNQVFTGIFCDIFDIYFLIVVNSYRLEEVSR